jgi:hypothetical protein
MHSSNRVVSAWFRGKTLELYPGLLKRGRLFLFFEYLVFSSFVDRNAFERRTVVSREVLLKVLGLPVTANSAAFKAVDLLEECAACIPLLKLEWSEHDYENGSARVILDDGLSAPFLEALQKELGTFHLVPDAEKVRFITGERVDTTTRTSLSAAERHDVTNDQHLLAPVAKVADYLNALPSNGFSMKVRQNIDRAVEAARSLPSATQRGLELSKLHWIVMQPQPFYGPSDEGKTIRLFAKNVSILGLKNVVKYALIDGWSTLDLKSAQLAIVATDWNITAIRGWLANPTCDIWRELCGVLPHIPIAGAKPVIKQAVYSACYGAQVETVEQALRGGLELSRADSSKVLSHEFFVLLFAHAKDRLTQIRANGGALDCFGEHLVCQSRVEARSVLARLSQAREMQLLLPAVDYALNNPKKLRIMLWEHDGFSVHFRLEPKRNEKTKRELLQTVNDRCAALGYPTKLVEKVS